MEDFRASKNPCVKCPYCDIEACRSCCSRYIIDQRAGKCMNNGCDNEWTRQFLAKTFPKQWMSKEWKNMREGVLFDREKALLPATQPIAAELAEKDKIMDEIREVDKLMKELKNRRNNLEWKIQQMGQEGLRVEIGTRKQKQSSFVRACPSGDCRGYVDISWKCGLCSKKVCKDCHLIVDDASTHVCNEDDVATAKLLDKDTKPCPKCSTGIFKIAGCDQMWCTQCHTAFDWKTGRIETNVHNPHYFEYMRRTNGTGVPRNQGDHYVCGETVDHRVVRSLLSSLKNIGRARELVSNTIETVLHLRDVQMGKYRTDQVEDNLGLRVDYLLGHTTEAVFKTKVQRANKAFDKKREIFQVADLLQRTITEILLRMNMDFREYKVDANDTYVLDGVVVCDDDRRILTADVVEPYLQELKGIREYANECLVDISKTYGSKLLTMAYYSSHRGRPVSGGRWTRDVLW